jgi:hypothetical protein
MSCEWNVTLKIAAFWSMIQCGLVASYQHCKGTCFSVFCSENWSSRFPQNTGSWLQDHMVSHLRWLQLSCCCFENLKSCRMWHCLTFKRPMFAYMNTHKRLPLEIHFIYLGNTEIYRIFKTCCITCVLFSTKCR